MSAVRHDEADVVIVGSGWAGGIMAAELAKAGLDVVVLERGPGHDRAAGDFDDVRDELARRRLAYTQDTAVETWTLRHHAREDALPFRYPGAFTPGSGTGGSSLLYGAHCYRMLPRDFTLRSSVLAESGPAAIPADALLADWPIGYEDLEPAYAAFERMAGIGGVAGNLRGELRPGGNPFEGPRSSEFPAGPVHDAAAPRAFRDAAAGLGLHPYPIPGGTLAEPYTNPDGIARPACTLCGFCTGYPCPIGAKAEATVTVLPVARATGRCDLRTESTAFRVVHDRGRASGVLYRDAAGVVHEQRAATVVLAAYALNNVRLLLLSGLGTPYDPATGIGSVGRSYSYNAIVQSHGLFAGRRFARYVGSGASGWSLDDFSGAHLDAGALGFIGGGEISALGVGGGPMGEIPVPPGTPRWGAAFKQALHDWYDRAVTVGLQAEVLAYRQHHLDLDPRYRDAWGDPLLRLTFDWRENERRLVRHLRDRSLEILAAMEPDHVLPGADLPARFDGGAYRNTHNLGGAVMGDDPATSVVDAWLRTHEVDNVLVVGGSAFPQAPGRGPTGTICALAYRAAEGILRG